MIGCKNLIGYGLAPLRETSVLEHISLELPMECLSFVVFTSILDSIVDTAGNSLREIKVSNLEHAKSNPPVGKFLTKFHELLLIGDECDHCARREYVATVKTCLNASLVSVRIAIMNKLIKIISQSVVTVA